jgi:hypothetical protein
MLICNRSGQTAPATYWPDDTSAIADPRWRSNQPVTYAIIGENIPAAPSNPINTRLLA